MLNVLSEFVLETLSLPLSLNGSSAKRNAEREPEDTKVSGSQPLKDQRSSNVLAWVFCVWVYFASSVLAAAEPEVVRIGSKAFTESVVLGEICTQALRGNGVQCEHVRQLGGTQILWKALQLGEIDIYPDYTGTLITEVLNLPEQTSIAEIRDALAIHDLRMTDPIGFNNSYAIGMLSSRAREIGISTISELRDHPELTFGFSNEFMDRNDGWPGLRRTYNLQNPGARGLDHALAYRAIASGSIDVIDLYTTDAEIALYDLTTLEDDKQFFPRYEAVILYRQDLQTRAPKAVNVLDQLAGKIDAKTMRELNRLTKVDKVPDTRVAREFLIKIDILSTDTAQAVDESVWSRRLTRLKRNTIDHLVLVGISLGLAILIAIPAGVFAFKYRSLRQPLLAMVGLLQTIPSLALLVLFIPVLGLGTKPALMALFLYSLLPIVRNTITGLAQIPDNLRETADLLGLSVRQRLLWIELPMALPSILAGIKTAAVINVGTATIGALIGAGGYGQPILTGIRLDDIPLIMEGAIPAAVLAILIQFCFELGESLWLPRGLKSTRT